MQLGKHSVVKEYPLETTVLVKRNGPEAQSDDSGTEQLEGHWNFSLYIDMSIAWSINQFLLTVWLLLFITTTELKLLSHELCMYFIS